jgi:transposase
VLRTNSAKILNFCDGNAEAMERTAGQGGYPSDVSDEEWSLVVPYLTLMDEEAPQREYDGLPPWQVVYQQTQRWLRAGVFG